MRYLSFILLFFATCPFACSQRQSSVLRKGEIIKSFISAEKADTFFIRMNAGEFASIHITEDSVRIHAQVYDPDRKLIQWVDENRMNGEVVSLFSKKAGLYKIVVHWNFSPPFSGTYTIVLKKNEKQGKTIYERIRQMFDGYYDADKPGGVLLVMKDGQPVLRLAKGVANMECHQELNEYSEFEFASCSKQFTGFAIAKLIERGKLKLEDEIHTYLPELPVYGQPITIMNLLNHTSGIRNTDDLQLAGFGHQDITTLETCLNFAFAQKKLLFNPGERFSYSNTNYNLLAEIVSRISGEPFDAWCRKNIFEPYAMNNTWFKTEIGQYSDRTVHSYRGRSDGYTEIRNNWAATGASGLQISMRDLEKWISAMERLESTNRKLHSLLHTITNLTNGHPVYYAYGNQFNLTHKKNEIVHLGLVLGYRTILARYPGEKLAIAYMSNDDNDATYQRFYAIRDMLLGVENPNLPDLSKMPSVSDILTKEENDRNFRETVDINPYTGIYYSEELGTVWKVVYEEGRLTVRRQREDPLRLRSNGTDKFDLIAFERNEYGRVTSFRILENGIEFRKGN